MFCQYIFARQARSFSAINILWASGFRVELKPKTWAAEVKKYCIRNLFLFLALLGNLWVNFDKNEGNSKAEIGIA